jgi:hypothetical protein
LVKWLILFHCLPARFADLHFAKDSWLIWMFSTYGISNLP